MQHYALLMEQVSQLTKAEPFRNKSKLCSGLAHNDQNMCKPARLRIGYKNLLFLQGYHYDRYKDCTGGIKIGKTKLSNTNTHIQNPVK